MSSTSEVLQWKYSNFLINKNNNFNKKEILKILSSEDIDEAYRTISSWNSYLSTPLISLKKLNEKLKLNKIFYKEEIAPFKGTLELWYCNNQSITVDILLIIATISTVFVKSSKLHNYFFRDLPKHRLFNPL